MTALAAWADAWSEFSNKFPGVLGLLSLLAAFRGIGSTEHSFQEMAFRHRSLNRLLAVDDGLGHGVDAVFSGSIREFGSFNTVCCNQVALHRKLVSQAYRPRTMRSGGGDKNLQMNWLADAAKLFLGFRAQSRFPLGNIQNGVQQS